MFKYLPFGPFHDQEEFKTHYDNTIRQNKSSVLFAVLVKLGALETTVAPCNSLTLEGEEHIFAGTIGMLNADVAQSSVEIGYVQSSPRTEQLQPGANLNSRSLFFLSFSARLSQRMPTAFCYITALIQTRISSSVVFNGKQMNRTVQVSDLLKEWDILSRASYAGSVYCLRVRLGLAQEAEMGKDCRKWVQTGGFWGPEDTRPCFRCAGMIGALVRGTRWSN